MFNYVVKYVFKAEVRIKFYNKIINELFKKIDTANLTK